MSRFVADVRSFAGLIAFGQSKNSSIRLLVNSLIMQSEVVQVHLLLIALPNPVTVNRRLLIDLDLYY